MLTTLPPRSRHYRLMQRYTSSKDAQGDDRVTVSGAESRMSIAPGRLVQVNNALCRHKVRGFITRTAGAKFDEPLKPLVAYNTYVK